MIQKEIVNLIYKFQSFIKIDKKYLEKLKILC